MTTFITRGIALGFPLALGAALALGACGETRSGYDDTGNSPGLLGEEAGASPEGDAGVCLSETLKGEPVPLAMLIVMDRSGSMSDPSRSTGVAKWDMALNAMISFADWPGSAGSQLGLSIFPLAREEEGEGEPCDPTTYSPIVPIAPLPGNGVAIKEALLRREPYGATPMSPALQGGVNAMKGFLADNPKHEGVIILVTDGDPSGCSSTVQGVAGIAQAAAAGTPRIRTFVVGMEGATFLSLDRIAAAGKGAKTAFNASGGADGGATAQQQLLDALQRIRSGALACEYLVPKPDPSKGAVDPDSVEIEFFPGTDEDDEEEPPRKVKRVASAEECSKKTGGFYFDDPEHPERIILCPASCDDVGSGGPQAKLDIVLGCIKEVR